MPIISLIMLRWQSNTERAVTSKKEFYQQDFYIHHPLLDRIIQSKLQKCLKYGQVRQFIMGTKKPPTKKESVRVVEAPFVLGSTKKLEMKSRLLKRSQSGLKSAFSRPKTTNTVIRSRTSEPRIRQKLQYLMKEQEHIQETLRPTLNIKRVSELKI